MPLTPQDFVSKWKRVTAREKQTYQEHFIDLCHLVGHHTPNEDDPTGRHFGFEMGAAKELVEQRDRWLNATPTLPPPNPTIKALNADVNSEFSDLGRCPNGAEGVSELLGTCITSVPPGSNLLTSASMRLSLQHMAGSLI